MITYFFIAHSTDLRSTPRKFQTFGEFQAATQSQNE